MVDWAERWWAGFVENLPELANGVVILLIGIALAWTVRLSIRRLGTKYGVEPASRMLVARLSYVTIIVIFAFVAVSVGFPRLNLGAVVGALGITSLILGFALKDIVENFMSGLLILTTKPFGIGDEIVSGDHEGTVEAIQFRATFLRTYDNRRVVIPNAELYTNRVTVNTAYPIRRFNLEVTFPNEFPIPPVQEAILDLARSFEEILQDPAPEVLSLTSYDYANAVTLRFWVSPSNRTVYRHLLSKLNIAIDERMGELGIGNPRPEFVQVVHQDLREGDQAGRRARAPKKDT